MVKLTKVLEDVVFTSNTDSKSFDDIEIVDIAYSSLKCQEGYMFVALKGETVDINMFLMHIQEELEYLYYKMILKWRTMP